MLKLRIEGLPEEIDDFVDSIPYIILSKSKHYPNNNRKYVSVYLSIKAIKNNSKELIV